MAGMNGRETERLIQEALGLHQRGQVEAAMALYELVLREMPEHVEALHLLGVGLRQRGRADEAVGRIAQALALHPEHATAHSNLGAALQDLDRTEDALASYERALALRPDYPMALANSGNALRRLGRVDEAIARYRRALALQPRYPEALANLAAALLTTGELAEARNAVEASLQWQPRSAQAWCARGAILQRLGEAGEAVASYERALDCDGAHVDTLVNLATLAQQQRDHAAALDWAERAVGYAPRHAAAHLQRANALRALDRRGDALAAYRAAQAHGADAEVTAYMIATLEGAAPAAPPPRYVAALFDQYAPNFDDHLQSGLAYATPRLLTDALRPWLPPAAGAAADLPQPALDVLDAGCGTGLCAPLLRPYARHLAGVDLSAAMLERAQARGLYDVLACAELTAFLRSAPARAAYDVIVAADVLVYLGDLRPLFAAAGSALRPGGLFAFSVERAEGSVEGTGYLLQPSGRYAHAPAYIDSLPGFELLAAQPSTLRQERGVPVDGMLYVLRASGFLTGLQVAS